MAYMVVYTNAAGVSVRLADVFPDKAAGVAAVEALRAAGFEDAQMLKDPTHEDYEYDPASEVPADPLSD